MQSTMMQHQVEGAWYMTLLPRVVSDSVIELERDFEDLELYTQYKRVVHQRDIYFLSASEYIKYNVDSKYMRKYELQPFLPDYDEDAPDSDCTYCSFKKKIYVVVMFEEQQLLKVFSLNERKRKWVYLSEHNLELDIYSIKANSSPDELILIVDAELHTSDGRTFMYRYDPEKKELSMWKEFDFDYTNYLFIPKQLLD